MAAHSDVDHAEFTLERLYAATPSRVFAAWAEPDARTRWAPPSPAVLVHYEKADFRVGGSDVSWCGPRGAQDTRVEATYFDIVADERIIFVESVEEGGARQSVTLVSVELSSERGGCRLRLTAQITAVAGSDMIAGNRAGWTASLENLARELGTRPTAAS